MDNAQKAIMIGVGLFITIIIISAVLLITNLGTNLISNAREQLGTMSTALENQILVAYDGKNISGSELLSTIAQYENSNAVGVVVFGKDVSTVKYTGAVALQLDATDFASIGNSGGIDIADTKIVTFDTATKRNTLTEFNDATTGISKTSMYRSSVVKSAVSGKVIGIAFKIVQ